MERLKAHPVAVLLITFMIASCRHSNVGKEVGALVPMDSVRFMQAFRNFSTAPNFVAIRIRTDGSSKVITTEAPFLEGALCSEYGFVSNLKFDSVYNDQLLTGLVNGFVLKSDSALNNVGYYSYDTTYYKIVRDSLDALLMDTLSNEQYIDIVRNSFQENRYGAHYLIDRGFTAIRGCLAGFLYLEDREDKHAENK